MRGEGTSDSPSRLEVIRPKPSLWLLAGIATALAIFLLPIGRIALFDRREEHIAADAVDTLENGHWLVATDHGRPRLKKPPLSRWVAAASIAALSRTEFAVRLPFALAGLATLAVLIVWVKEIADIDNAVATGICFATNFLVVSECWVASAESLLMAAITVSLFAFWRLSNKLSTQKRPSAAWAIACGTALGLGVLAKGPIAFVLFGFAVAGFCILWNHSAWRLLLRPTVFLPAFLPAVVWAIAVLVEYPHAWTVWRHEILHKVSGPDARSMLLPKFLPMAAPWIALAVAGVFLPAIRVLPTSRGPLWLIWAWCVGNLAMFSAWSGAREPYYLSCMPAVAMLSGLAWTLACRDSSPRLLQWSARFQIVIGIGVIAGLPIAAFRESRMLLPAASAIAVLGLAVIVSNWRRTIATRRIQLIGFPIAFAIVGAVPEVQSRCERLSHREFCRRVETEAANANLLVAYLTDFSLTETDYMDDPDVTESIWFYLPRPPEPIPGATHLEARLREMARTTDGKPASLLLLVSPRQHQSLVKHGGFRIALKVDESTFARWDTRLLEVGLN